MVTGNIIKCSEGDEKVLDRKIIKENKMLMRLIKKKKKKRKSRKKHRTAKGTNKNKRRGKDTGRRTIIVDL